jgi:hypothetical protein
MRSPRDLLLATALALFFVSAPARATSYNLLSDAGLADQAAVIVQATVLASEPAPVSGPPSTDTFIQVERVLKGYVAGSTVVVRVLGGIGPDGLGLRIWGAPFFRPGERVLLFLEPREDGTYAVLHMMLGAFFEVEDHGRRWAARNLTEAVEAYPAAGLSDSGVGGRGDDWRDFQEFVDWLTDRGRGVHRPADYFVEMKQAAGAMSSPPILLEDRCTQLNFRWFEFDRGGRVSWRFHRAGINGRGGGKLALAAARGAWRGAGGSGIRFTSGGVTRSQAGFAEMDGLNTVIFNDPDDLVAGRFTCASGGVVAVAGIWFDNGRNQDCQAVDVGQKGRVNGELFLKILSADIVTNDGSSCLFADDPAASAEVLAHELGHGLGLAHSEAVDALMHGQIHGDGRGAELHPADLTALAGLYPPR